MSGEPASAVRSVVFRQCPSSAKHNLAHWLLRENITHIFPYDLKLMPGKYFTKLYRLLITFYSHIASIGQGNVPGLCLSGRMKDTGGG